MNDLTKILTASLLALTVSLALPGCGESSSPTSGERHSADDGHDHAQGDHKGQDQAEGEHDDHDDHSEGDMRSLGSMTIAGTTFAVSVSSDIKPSSEVHLDITVESGPIPAAIRFWVGNEAGTGALKAKADAHDDHFHGHSETPETLNDASLWIEVETTAGERIQKSTSLQ